jgi:choline dehydrogenase-like flavoprotein
MQIDLAQTESPSPIRSQVCIIGGGMAGLTLAHRLTQQGIDIALLEAGGLTPDPSAEDRVFGGTSLRWGGQLLPLPASSWAIEDLAPYYHQAEQLLAVDDLPYDAPAFFSTTKTTAPTILPGLLPSISKWTPFSDRNLASTLGKSLRNNPHANIYLHAPATELLLAPTRDRIEAVLVRTPAGHTLRFEAPHIVVAAGTLETSRLLLASRSVEPTGVGNQHDQVGRNLHDHLTIRAATLTGPARASMLRDFRPWIFGQTTHSYKLEASPTLRRQLSLNPAVAFLTFEDPQNSGLAAVRDLLTARQRGDFAATLLRQAPHLPSAALQALRLAWQAKRHHRRFISAQTEVHLKINIAQDAASLSRLTLSPDLDTLAQPKPIVDWHITPNELATLRNLAHHLRSRLDTTGLSDGMHWTPELFTPNFLEHSEPSDQARDSHLLDDARHPMGGACLGTDPRTSVVDPNLTVHGIPNLHLASAATFPDGTPQLPTLPLMALTLRLADRLALRLKS